jgi:hypothetical protein
MIALKETAPETSVNFHQTTRRSNPNDGHFVLEAVCTHEKGINWRTVQLLLFNCTFVSDRSKFKTLMFFSKTAFLIIFNRQGPLELNAS